MTQDTPTISYSSLATFKSCKKKYFFKNQLGLVPKRSEGASVSVGKSIHGAFESYFRGIDIKSCHAQIIKDFDKAIGESQSMNEEEDQTVGKYIALGMWENYPFTSVIFNKIYPEQKFKVPVKDTGIDMVGVLDGLIFDQGKYWIREVKTTGMNLNELKRRADVSYQATGYIWAMQQILKQRVHGVFYDMIRKPLLRKGQYETATTFGERNYDYYKDPANQSKLYDRHYSYRSELQLNLFEQDLLADITDMNNALDTNSFQRSTDACFMYGRECPYKSICFQEVLDPIIVDGLFDKRQKSPDDNTLTLGDEL